MRRGSAPEYPPRTCVPAFPHNDDLVSRVLGMLLMKGDTRGVIEEVAASWGSELCKGVSANAIREFARKYLASKNRTTIVFMKQTHTDAF